MSNAAIKITESLMLRRVDPVDMLKKYLAGEFVRTEIPAEKVSMSSFVNVDHRIGNDTNAKIYRLTDKTNVGQVIVTTNHDQYSYAKNISDGKQPVKRKNWCLWSKREINEESVGIPVAMEIDRYNNKITFYVEDAYYNFECAIAGLKRLYSCHRNYKDPLYMDAEQMLHCMYYRLYPDRIGTRINEAKDWRLLDINGGPLTEEEYDSDQHKYIQLPNVVIIPIKRQYIKLTVPKKQ